MCPSALPAALAPPEPCYRGVSSPREKAPSQGSPGRREVSSPLRVVQEEGSKPWAAPRFCWLTALCPSQ